FQLLDLDGITVFDQCPGETEEHLLHGSAAVGLDALDAKQTGDALGGLGTLPEPVIRPFLVDHDGRRLGLRVVLADRFDRAAITRRALVGDNDSPDRVLLRTNSSKSDTDCHWTRNPTGSQRRRILGRWVWPVMR